MEQFDLILKSARSCHTKLAWEELFSQKRDQIIGASNGRLVADLFKLLRADSQCLQYDPALWSALLEGCLSCWNLELGTQIAEFSSGLPSSKTAIPAAKVYMESGHPLLARKTANRALRLSTIDSHEQLQLEMIICRSYVEEGNRPMAIRLLNKMLRAVKEANMDDQERAQFLINIARTHFFLGRYTQAGKLFYEGYEIYIKLENWAESARAVYNAGSSYFNAGGKLQENAFAWVEECRRISEAHDLPGPLSHVEAFYGHDDYWHGNFAGARDHYRRAHKYLPTSDKSFRTLHVLSMLALIYLRTGQYNLAKHFGEKTLDLAALDESERFRSRYQSLRAELMWESGLVEESQSFLRENVQQLISKGVNTLEELSTLSRYYRQCAILSESGVPQKIKISDQLQKNTGDWIEYLHSLAQFYLSQGAYCLAKETFESGLSKAKAYGDKYHYGLCLLGLVQLKLAQNHIDLELQGLINELEIALARLVETPIKLHVHFIRAGLAYRQGDFEGCKLHLVTAAKSTRFSYIDNFTLSSWLATMEGRSCRLNLPWQEAVLAQLTKIYFSPSLKYAGNRIFIVSGRYEVNLAKHPALADVIEFLLQKNKFAALPGDIQNQVWKQSLAQQGWQQKIRNTIMRLRTFFPYTLAPLLLHSDDIRLFSEGIRVDPLMREDLDPREEILRLLREGPMSSIKLSNRINVSAATTKRILKKLAEAEKITMMKIGRNVIYQTISNESAN
jgi:tetratricopeptide (TPR) repeat protein